MKGRKSIKIQGLRLGDDDDDEFLDLPAISGWLTQSIVSMVFFVAA